jgi:hypothetical protein
VTRNNEFTLSKPAWQKPVLMVLKFLGFVLALAVIPMTCIGMENGCGVGDTGKQAVEKAGFKNVVIGARAWFSCGEDSFSSYFTADNAQGQRVMGTVCCGVLKNCTVRF